MPQRFAVLWTIPSADAGSVSWAAPQCSRRRWITRQPYICDARLLTLQNKAPTVVHRDWGKAFLVFLVWFAKPRYVMSCSTSAVGKSNRFAM